MTGREDIYPFQAQMSDGSMREIPDELVIVRMGDHTETHIHATMEIRRKDESGAVIASISTNLDQDVDSKDDHGRIMPKTMTVLLHALERGYRGEISCDEYQASLPKQ